MQTEISTEEQVPGHDNEVEVEVLNTKSNREVKFEALWTSTLQQVWDAAYREFHPPEQRDPQDKFQCQKAGVDLTPYLGLTVRQAHDQHICTNRHYQIVGGTGGA